MHSAQRITRRSVLRLGMLGAAGAVLAGCAGGDADGSPATPSAASAAASEHIVVIGAGMAGLAAARELARRGLRVTVLEARDRIGGRIWTNHTWADAPVDLGASWIHGVRGNPITALAKEFKVQTRVTDYDSYTLYDAAGRRLAEARQSPIFERAAEVYEQVEDVRQERQAAGEPDISLAAATEQVLEAQPVSERARHELDYALGVEVELDYGADLADLSLYHWDSDAIFGGSDVIFPEGYDLLVHGLAAGLAIALNTRVSQVAATADGVTISSDQGQWQADRVIVTVPLGVLQSGAVHFEPPLPERKQQALARLRMGVLDKVCLRFAEPFWSRDETHFISYMSVQTGQWAEHVNMHPLTGVPLLIAFNADTFARELEPLSDADIVAADMDALRAMYGSSVPDPEGWLITRWAGDPFALGSYSHIPPGATPDDYDALAEPVGERLFFAGEATNARYPATVHGAYLSGMREAERVVALLRL